jgi:putative transposase
MREDFTVGSFVHVLNRGAKKLPIYRQKGDLWRMLFNLFYLNSAKVPDNWARGLEKLSVLANLKWPNDWGDKKPLVSVLAFTIMPNHFHLILKETQEGGIKEFMHKFTMAYSKFINAKYDESGSLFQGRYKSQTIQTDKYLRYLAVYVMVKNTFELYPEGGLLGAKSNFDKAYEWAIEYPFTSLGDYAGRRHSSIIEKDLLGEIFTDTAEFKEFARDCILGRKSDMPDFFD